MSKQKIDRNYVSEIGQFLQDFDKQHPEKSSSQQKEIDKHKAIFDKRDGVVKEKPSFLEDF